MAWSAAATVTRPFPAPDRDRRHRRAGWHGPPPSLPATLDRVADAWYRLTPRLRLAVGLAAATLVLLTAGAGAVRSPWGPPVTVVVTAVDRPPGSLLTAADVATARRPRRLVPSDAVAADEAVGARLAGAVVAGTVLTARHLADDAGPGAGLAPGRAAFPVPAGPLVDVRPGQRVDVVAGDAGGRGRTLAAGARVLTVTAEVVWLDVARDDAPDLAAAAAWDGLRLVLLPG